MNNPKEDHPLSIGELLLFIVALGIVTIAILEAVEATNL